MHIPMVQCTVLQRLAVKTLSDGIRMDTIATDIKVTTIQPGIVETPF